MLNPYQTPLILVLLGALLIALGIFGLGDYRRSLFRNPRQLMKAEVFLNLFRAGPSLMVMCSLLFGGWFLLTGVALLIANR